MDNADMSELITDDGSTPSAESMFTYLYQELWRSEQSIAQSGRLTGNDSLIDERVTEFIEGLGRASANQLTDFTDEQKQALGNEVLTAYYCQKDEKQRFQSSFESARRIRREIASLSEDLIDRSLLLESTPGNPWAIDKYVGDTWKDDAVIERVVGTLAEPREFRSPVLESTNPITLKPASIFERLRGVTYQARLLNRDGEPLVSLSLAQ